MYLALDMVSAGCGRACRVDMLAGGSWCTSAPTRPGAPSPASMNSGSSLHRTTLKIVHSLVTAVASSYGSDSTARAGVQAGSGITRVPLNMTDEGRQRALKYRQGVVSPIYRSA